MVRWSPSLIKNNSFLQVLLRHHQTSHQHSSAAMLWYYHGVLHPLQYSYTTLSQCGWPTLTVPVLLPSQCSIPPPLPSLSVETTSLPVQAHQSVISMCGVSLLSILLVVASLLTVLHLYHLYQVSVFLISHCEWLHHVHCFSSWCKCDNFYQLFNHFYIMVLQVCVREDLLNYQLVFYLL